MSGFPDWFFTNRRKARKDVPIKVVLRKAQSDGATCANYHPDCTEFVNPRVQISADLWRLTHRTP